MRPLAAQWGILLGLSALLVAVLEWLRLPAALLLGPMAAGIVIAAGRGRVRVPTPPFVAAQAVLGCMIARNIPLSVVAEMAHHWPLFLAGVAIVISATLTFERRVDRFRSAIN